MKKNIVEIRNLHKSFDDNIVLKNISLKIKEGTFISLLGPSGCGKTVFLKILSNLMTRTSGDIHFHFAEKKRINISFAFQKSSLFPWLTIFENIKICMNNEGLTDPMKNEMVMHHLQKAYLEKYKDYYPHQISGGMTQKVNILRCFCCQSELILMDEPFVFLDFIQRRELQDFTLKIWEEQKKTILFITHNIDEAILLSDRILLMSALPGKIIKEFQVGLNRPRTILGIRSDPQYLELFKNIDDSLGEEIKKNQKELLL